MWRGTLLVIGELLCGDNNIVVCKINAGPDCVTLVVSLTSLPDRFNIYTK